MKILFIGPYRQSDGWGNAAKEYIRALSKVEGAELAIRPIYMGSSYCDLEEDLLEYEFNDFREYDLVIQNVLPHLCEYNAKFKKNVILFYTESDNLQNTAWPSRVNLMDEAWVPSNQEKNNLKNSGVNIPIKVVPIPLNVNKFDLVGDSKVNIPGVGKDTFVFYTSGEFVQRKNTSALVSAFHSEFDRNEDVALVIKSNKAGLRPAELSNHMLQKFNGVKARLRLYPNPSDYKNEIVVTEYLEEQTLLALYNSCDCFVMPSHGESWCIPAMESMALGKPCIVTSNTGMADFVTSKNGWVVKSQETIPMVKDAPLPDLYTGRESWREINTIDLKKCMRRAFEDVNEFKKKSENCKKDTEQYSYENVSVLIKEVLDDCN